MEEADKALNKKVALSKKLDRRIGVMKREREESQWNLQHTKAGTTIPPTPPSLLMVGSKPE